MACNGRCFLIAICVIQLLATVERQVFDFLGFMWAPVIGNFLQLFFCIIGLVGVCQFRHRVLIAYAAWSLLWIAWNAFVICFYLEVGILKRSDPYLNIGTDHQSWWIDHGIGCRPMGNASNVTDAPNHGCFLPFYYVEVIHAGVQCLLAIIGFIVACVVAHIFTEEDDSSQPVHDELEYIKMRYRSPARQSFRTNRTYDNFTVSRSNTLDRTLRSNRHGTEDDRKKQLVDDKQTNDKDPLYKKDINDHGDVVLTQTPSPMTPLKNSSDFDCGDSHECSTLQTRIA